jgi:rhodanese-related sulfurtransferase
MKKLFILALPLIMGVACTAQQTPEDVNSAQATELMQSDEVVVLDVRTQEEWDKGHIEGAQHMDFYKDDFDSKLAELPKDKEYVVYCHSGGRSAKTVAKMKQAGFEKVHNLQGGITAWKSEGNETVE